MDNKLTYRQLKSMIAKLNDKQLDSPVAVVDLDDGDVFEIEDFVTNWKVGDDPKLDEWLPDQIDPNHPFLPFAR